MSVLLADIGGTHARIALFKDNHIGAATKHSLKDFTDAAALFKAYEGQSDRVMIAAAGRLDKDGVWRIGNHNDWEIDPNALRGLGIDHTHFIHDFVALAQGALALPQDQLITLYEGDVDHDHQRVIAGAGTGLGLAIATPTGDSSFKILRSHGGFNLAVTHTQEQMTVVNLVRRLQDTGEAVCYEDMVSGRGLPILYKAVAMTHGLDIDWPATPDLIALSKTVTGAQTLRLFHEFLGYFLQGVSISAHATGGIYLDGGVIQKLYETGLFDLETVLGALHLCDNKTVSAMLRNIPVYLVNTENVALHGLSKMVVHE